MTDVAIVGGGPAGLALAIHAARQGLVTRLFERQGLPRDKACGEGLLHPGLREITFGLPADLDPATPGADMIRAAEHLRGLALRLPEWAIHRAFCMLHRRATVTATAAGFELHQTLVGGDDVHEETTTTARDPRADATALLEVLGL